MPAGPGHQPTGSPAARTGGVAQPVSSHYGYRMLPQNLGPGEVRVLGSLVEKELSTPDHYPLSLNALAAACNQSSNREPVMAMDEGTVSDAVTVLRRVNLVRSFQGSGWRVPKFQHLLTEAGELSRAELAVLCVLMLRGPQTAGELRSRAARLTPDGASHDLEVALDALIARGNSSPVARLPRRPGQKEARFTHLLAGAVVYDGQDGESEIVPSALAPSGAPQPAADRTAILEERVKELAAEVSDLRSQFAAFRRQFE